MKKNAAFIIPSLKNGGAERVLSTISMNLDENINQYIFTWNGKEPDYDFNGEIVEIDIQNSTSLIKNINVLFKRVKEVKKYKKQYNIDTCISHLEGPNIVNLLSKGNEKTVITVHNFQSKERTGLYGFIFRTLMRLLYNRADKIVAVSNAIKEDLANNFNINEEKIEVIYNPFDCKSIEELATEELEEEYKEIFENDVIINVGRLTKQKGQWHLIKSFYELKKLYKDIKLVILGKGELEDELKELVEILNLNKDVFFLGYHKNPFKFIKNSKVFALTSLYEGFPMCLAESMICGTPIVSVDCKSGPREMLDIKNIENKDVIQFVDYGVLVDNFKENKVLINYKISKDEKDFARAINTLINNNEYYDKYSKLGNKRAYEFDLKNIIVKWHNLIIERG